MKTKLIAYWTLTALVAFAMLSGGAAQFARETETIQGLARLGYPIYFATILGFWKVMGGIALLIPRFPRLKEWAYAGVFFDLTGAAASHLAVGEYGPSAFHVIVPLLIAAMAVGSWALRPESRRLSQ